MKILLTGGSGTVGREVLAFLSKQEKYDIVVFDVNTKKSRAIYRNYSDKITLVYGDITQRQEVEKVCHQVDFVIHLAAIIPPLADEKPKLAHQVNTIGTQNLIQSLEKYSPKAFFLYSSSVSVYGDRLKDYMIRIGDKIQASEGDEYAKTKIEAEQMIQESQLNWSIFRLSAIMGTNNHKVSSLMFHMPLATKMEITTPKDTARAFVNSIPKQSAINHKIFNLGGGENCRLTYESFLTKNFVITGLGELTFPPNSFAEKNFHCGYYADGDDLQDIVHFRNDDLNAYFSTLKSSVSKPQFFFTRLFRNSIKRYLTKLSEPLQAIKEDNQPLINRFF